MISQLLLSFVLVGIPIAEADSWGGLGVCVQFLHRKTGDFLVASLFSHDTQRHCLELAGNTNLWVIYEDPDYKGYHYIKHKERGEELFEYVQNNKVNYVLLWMPKIINDGSSSWMITAVEDGYYILKNKKFNNCLCSKSKDRIRASEGCDSSEYQWKITKIAC